MPSQNLKSRPRSSSVWSPHCCISDNTLSERPRREKLPHKYFAGAENVREPFYSDDLKPMGKWIARIDENRVVARHPRPTADTGQDRSLAVHGRSGLDPPMK